MLLNVIAMSCPSVQQEKKGTKTVYPAPVAGTSLESLQRWV